MPAHRVPDEIKRENRLRSWRRYKNTKYATDPVWREEEKRKARIRDRQRYSDFKLLKSMASTAKKSYFII